MPGLACTQHSRLIAKHLPAELLTLQIEGNRITISQLSASNGTFLLSNVSIACMLDDRLPGPSCTALVVGSSEALKGTLLHIQQQLTQSAGAIAAAEGVTEAAPEAGSDIIRTTSTPAPHSNTASSPVRPHRLLLSLTGSYTVLPEELARDPLLMYAPMAGNASLHIAFFGHPASSTTHAAQPRPAECNFGGGSSSSRGTAGSGLNGVTVLDFSGRPGLFVAGVPENLTPTAASGSLAFYDLVLTRLPYAVTVKSWLDLSAVTGHILDFRR